MNRSLTILSRLALAALLALLLTPVAQADDRRLITGFEEIPTVFFLFDTSGSMHWSSQCSQADFDAGECDRLCPTGSCFTPGNADSPNSKLYQAKAAIYSVLEQTEGLNVGFATFNQDELRLRRKHWLYEALEDGPSIPGWGPYPRGRTTGGGDPVAGDWHTFGKSWACTTGAGSDANIGCAGATPAHLDDLWESERVQALPKETPDFNGNSDTYTTNYVRSPNGNTYQVRFGLLQSLPHTLGDPTITVSVRTRQCLNTSCSSTGSATTVNVSFGLMSDFGAWDFSTDRGPEQSGFFSQGTVSDTPASNTCSSWDPNTDTSQDRYNGYNARFPTVADPSFSPLLDVGDVLPLDWRNDNKQKLLERLAPNLALGELTPDFRVARYFQDIINPSNELHLKNESARPIMSFGSTPIGASVEAFYNWVSGPSGWQAVAAANDPSAACRNAYLVVLTDGNETCGGDPCNGEGTAELFDGLGIKTFVVAFGVRPHVPILPACVGDPDEEPDVTCCAGAGPTCVPTGDPSIPPVASRDNRFLRCMAAEGGTGAEDWDGDGILDSEDGTGVIYPQNQSELVDALVAILDQLKPDAASFASAAVPSVQAEAADKVFLSEFTPIPERSTWMGKINAFLKPVPVDADNKPDTSIICPPDDLEDPTDDPSACLLWEAGQVILDNQTDPSDPVGDLPNQRRLFYSEFDGGVPKTRRFLEPTQDGVTAPAVEFDFWRGFNIDFDPLDSSTYADARTDANDIVDFVTSVKTTPVSADFPVAIDYILPDVFHSDPLLLGSPENLLYFFKDLNGYRQFAIDHAFRRRVLVFGTNGGIVHGLDAGVCRDLARADPRVCLFDNGSGRELFGFIPRTAMPILNQLALDTVPRQRYAVDGRTQAADVYIDPLHEGALSPVDPPEPTEREWRTVLLGGLREGGYKVPLDIGDLLSPADSNPADGVLPSNEPQSGFYALDLTQPDPLEVLAPGEDRPPVPQAVGVNPPSCLQTNDGITPVDPECGTVAYAAPLWEFTDSIEGVRLDEDDNGHVDLAYAWSTPNIGRIQVCTADCDEAEAELEDRYVAIVGGGYDPKSPFLRGNFIYMIDMETGETLYKRSVVGAVAAEPAAVDTDFDGYLDTIYIGTSLGRLYRVNLGAFDDDGNPATDPKYPQVQLITVEETATDGSMVSRDVERIIDPDFGPFLLLETSDPLAIPPQVRPIFYRPSVIYLPKFNKYAIAVGTGNREDIFRRDQPTGRFFVFVDDVTQSEIMSIGFVPFSPTNPDLTPLTTSSPRLEDVDLLSPGEGWWIELEANERVVTEPFALSGVLFFSTFVPDPEGPEVIPENSLCREKGVSNIYGVFTSNADGLLADDDEINSPDQLVRYLTVSGLVSAPFAEQSQTKNPKPPEDQSTVDDLTARLKYVRDRLKQQFPENCTFPPGYRLDVKTRSSGTNLNFIAPVPICVVEKSFREF
jgi:hypothetical protein